MMNDNSGDNKSNNITTCPDNYGRYIYGIFHILMTLVSIYLAVRCTGVNVLNLIIAIICPYIYIIYNIIMYNGLCEKK